VALRTFTLWCNHHLHSSPELFHLSKPKLCCYCFNVGEGTVCLYAGGMTTSEGVEVMVEERGGRLLKCSPGAEEG
jgi:hypothetical protein